jgi:hypothetical protein
VFLLDEFLKVLYARIRGLDDKGALCLFVYRTFVAVNRSIAGMILTHAAHLALTAARASSSVSL